MASTEARYPVYPARKLYVAFELASRSWKVGLTDSPGRKPSIVTLPPFDESALRSALARARQRMGLSEATEVLICMEAGRDGFSVYRWLEALDLESLVIDPASVEVNRQKRRAKTDRLDVLKLLDCLIRHDGGWKKVWQVCHVPSEEAEDRRHLHREREALVKARTKHINRIKGLLVAQGIRLQVKRSFLTDLEQARDPRGNPVRAHLQQRLVREFQRLELVREQLAEIELGMKARVSSEGASQWDRKVWQLAQLVGLGKVTAHTLTGEFFGWRDFGNRGEVGSSAGLTPTPHNTGESEREQGISKAGNHRVRRVMIELAWSWLRFQPDSELATWYRRKFVDGGKRQGRKGIVALARRLLIALWHFVEHGLCIEGARMVRGSPLAAQS